MELTNVAKNVAVQNLNPTGSTVAQKKVSDKGGDVSYSELGNSTTLASLGGDLEALKVIQGEKTEVAPVVAEAVADFATETIGDFSARTAKAANADDVKGPGVKPEATDGNE